MYQEHGPDKAAKRHRSNKRPRRKAAAKGRSAEKRDDRRDPSVDDRVTSTINDISWYAKFPQLLDAAGMLPFPVKPGMFFAPRKGSSAFNRQSPASVWVVDWQPSVGVSKTNTDPASLVAKQLYTRVRSVYSSELDADGPDMLIYLLALDSIFSYIASLKRILRLTISDNPFNYDMPDGVLTGLGFSQQGITNLRANRVLLWQNINELIAMTRRFKCPAVMDYFNRHYWMNDNIFSDAQSPSAQLFVFNQTFYYKWSVNTENNAGQVVPVLFSIKSGDEVAGLFDFGLQLIEALSNAGSSYTISGYLTRAFPDTPSFSVDEAVFTETATAVFSEEVLSQIENSRTVCFNPYLVLDSSNAPIQQNWIAAMTVMQDVTTNAVQCPQQFSAPTASNAWEYTGDAFTPSALINLHTFDVVPAIVAIASRMQTLCEFENPVGSDSVVVVHSGSEVTLRNTLVQRLTDGSFRSFVIPSVQNISSETTATTLTGMLQSVAMAEQFDWHPLLFIGNGVTTYNKNLFIYGDVLNINSFNNEEFKNLNKICLYSEFNSFAI